MFSLGVSRVCSGTAAPASVDQSKERKRGESKAHVRVVTKIKARIHEKRMRRCRGALRLSYNIRALQAESFRS
jgi:hypothetical protein